MVRDHNGKVVHDSDTLARIAKAREHYQTRSDRRPKGASMSDPTLYRNGLRLPALMTHELRRRSALVVLEA